VATIQTILALGALLLASSAMAATPVRLPPGESGADWRPAFKMADLEAAGVDAESAVLIEDRGSTWVLWARDDSGIVREVEVSTPTSSTDREDVAWLIVSLLNPSPTIDLGLPPRMEERPKDLPPRIPVVAPEPVTEPAPAPEPEPESEPILVVAPIVVEEPEPEPRPSELLTFNRGPRVEPVLVELEMAADYEPYRGPVLPFASITASTDARLGALPSPSFELAGGVDIVGRVRTGLTIGATAPTPVSWTIEQAATTMAGSLEIMGFGSVGLDPRGRVRIGGAVGARNIRYVPIAPGSFHVGEAEFVPTLRVEAGYGFRIARSIAAMPTVAVQVDVLDDTPVSTRPADMFPVSIRVGLRIVALRDVDFHLAPPPPPPFTNKK